MQAKSRTLPPCAIPVSVPVVAVRVVVIIHLLVPHVLSGAGNAARERQPTAGT